MEQEVHPKGRQVHLFLFYLSYFISFTLHLFYNFIILFYFMDEVLSNIQQCLGIMPTSPFWWAQGIIWNAEKHLSAAYKSSALDAILSLLAPGWIVFNAFQPQAKPSH